MRARGVEYAEQFHLNYEDRANPTSHRHWGDDILRIYTGHDDSLRGELAFYDPIRIVFARLAQDRTTEQQLTDTYIGRFCTPEFQELCLIDGNNRLVKAGEPDFYRLYNSRNRQDPELMRERASDFLAMKTDALAPLCTKLFLLYDGKIPSASELRNLRMDMNLETGAFSVSRPNVLEKITDATLGRVRDARTGSLISAGCTTDSDEMGQAAPEDRFANWVVNQPLLRPLATFIGNHYSSLIKPDPVDNQGVSLDEWRKKRQVSHHHTPKL